MGFGSVFLARETKFFGRNANLCLLVGSTEMFAKFRRLQKRGLKSIWRRICSFF